VAKFQNGHKKLGGKKPGTPNKFTSLKSSFLETFEAVGGTAGLTEWVRKSDRNKAIFYQMVTRLFPQEVALGGAPEGSSIRIEVVHLKPQGGNGNGREKGPK
jgi:hypothetical protein